MAGTLADMISRIAREIRRSNLTTEITEAIQTAIEAYQKQRFRFSDVDPLLPPVINTVVGQWAYSVTDNANIPTILHIDYFNVLVGSTVFEMQRRTPEEIHLLNQQNQQSGQPTDWAYEGNKIIIYPIPSEVWEMRLGGHLSVAAPATTSEVGNPWMLVGERLIRSRAKFELALNVTRDKEMQAAMNPKDGASYDAWCDLKGEANKVTGTGRIRPMRF